MEGRQMYMFGEKALREKEQAEPRRAPNGQFLPGSSGNPSGRVKPTREERKALEEIKDLAPGVADRMREMLDDEKVPPAVRVRIMEIILERTYGKPEAAIKLTTAQQSVEAAQTRISAIVSQIRIGETNE